MFKRHSEEENRHVMYFFSDQDGNSISLVRESKVYANAYDINIIYRNEKWITNITKATARVIAPSDVLEIGQRSINRVERSFGRKYRWRGRSLR